MDHILPKNLKYLRSSRRPMYSQREMAQKLHVSRSAYCRYERGDCMPPLCFLQEISTFYGIEMNVLINEDLQRSEITKNENITQADATFDKRRNTENHG